MEKGFIGVYNSRGERVCEDEEGSATGVWGLPGHISSAHRKWRKKQDVNPNGPPSKALLPIGSIIIPNRAPTLLPTDIFAKSLDRAVRKVNNTTINK